MQAFMAAWKHWSKGERTAAMAILLLGTVFVSFYGPIAAPSRSTFNAAPGQAEHAALADRFAVKFCYAQYRNQSDISHCLMNNSPL